MVDNYSAEDLAKAGRFKQIRMVAKLVNEQNRRALPIIFGSAVAGHRWCSCSSGC